MPWHQFFLGNYAFGVYGGYNVANFLALAGELSYMRNWYFLKMDRATNVTFIQVGYVPLSVIVKIFSQKHPNFRFFGCIRVGRIVNAQSVEVVNTTGFKSFSQVNDAKKEVKDIDLSKDETLKKWTFDVVVGYEYE